MKAKSKNTTPKKAPAKKAPTVKATAKKAKATAKPAEMQKQAPAPASGEQTRFEMIDIENINSSNNVRTETTDISDLVESIKANGIINPITVSYNKNSLMFDVVAGHRRFAAAKLAGIVMIPCHIIDGKSENELNEIAIQENTIRVDMTPYEECIAIKNLVNKNNTPRQIAARFGRTLRWVLVRVKLANAGDKVLEKVKAGSISMANAAKLADLPDKEFADEMRCVYRLNDYTTKCILERHHMDLKKAPFDTCDCSTCAKCSAQQQDLFAEENVNYCLDPKCWAKKCKARANEKKKEFESKGIIVTVSENDSGRPHRIKSWEKEKLEQAKQAGIKKRVFIDPKTCRKEEYYDERDLPNFHEETEEERDARIEQEEKETERAVAREDVFVRKIKKQIKVAIRNFGDSGILALFAVFKPYSFICDEEAEKFGIASNYGEIKAEDIPDDCQVGKLAAIVRNSLDNLIDEKLHNVDKLKKIWNIFVRDENIEGRKSLEDLEPTEDEILAEIAMKQAAEENEDDDD